MLSESCSDKGETINRYMVLVMAKSYVKELHFGQTNILLGTLHVGHNRRCARSGGQPGAAPA